MSKEIIKPDAWFALKQFTQARIALGRTGMSIPMQENLQFRAAHAFARDAIFTVFEKEMLADEIRQLHGDYTFLHSKVIDRHMYLQRPDLGKQLDDRSIEELAAIKGKNYDLCINIADGLSATAVNAHAIPLLRELLPALKQTGYSIAPICIIEQGRVAISDETGSLLNTKLSLILIGERPGLSTPDSLGAYITYQPKPGNTDAQRNCVPSIHAAGLSYANAAQIIHHLIKHAFRLGLSGIGLKDQVGEPNDPALPDTQKK
jgi:ethanolamine ammonia-lyase small subunit